MESDQTEVNRRENTLALARQSGSKARFAERIGRSAGQVGHIIGKTPTKNIGKPLARHIEKCFKKEKFWLDKVHAAVHSAARAKLPAQFDAEAIRADTIEEKRLRKYLTDDAKMTAVKEISDGMSAKDAVKLAQYFLSHAESEL